jgi:hypothetical protein
MSLLRDARQASEVRSTTDFAQTARSDRITAPQRERDNAMHDDHVGHPDIHWPAGFTPPNADCYCQTRMLIHAPADRVFGLLADVEDWPKWVPEVTAVQRDNTATAGLQHLQAFEFALHDLRVEALVGEYLPNSRLGWSGIGTGLLLYHSWLFLEFPHGTDVVTETVARGPVAQAMKEAPPTWASELGRQWLSELKNLAEE